MNFYAFTLDFFRRKWYSFLKKSDKAFTYIEDASKSEHHSQEVKSMRLRLWNEGKGVSPKDMTEQVNIR